VGGQLLVDLSHGVKLALDLFSVQRVNEHLQVLLPVKGHTGSLAGNRSGVDLFNRRLELLTIINITISSRIAAWTAVRVLLLGLF